MFLNKNLGQVWCTAMSFDLTPVRLLCGAEECVGGEETPGDFTVIKSLIHTHTRLDMSVKLEKVTHNILICLQQETNLNASYVQKQVQLGDRVSPGWMLSRMMVTWSSRSGRVCSCQKPITWPSSCTTMPNLSQFLPMEIAWGPLPRRPT